MRIKFILGLLFVFAMIVNSNCTIASETPPKLILQITVDGLRGDIPGRYIDRFGKGGFKYLFDKGIVYTNAQYQHSNLETVVGHSVLATGAFPAAHGMVANVWMDRETGQLGYAVEDSNYEMVGAKGGVDKDAEIDPTQAAAKSEGRSPQAILCSTFSDELAKATAGQSKIFGVSVKDRGAITLAGHAGKAFWFSKKTGEFVSSTYYYDQYPDWVNAWNEKRLAGTYEETSWKLLNDPDSYTYKDSDDRPYETAMPGYGRVFPHPFGEKDNKLFYTFLTLSPVGDDLTLDFAKTLIKNEKIGQDEVTDYLSVSFSSTDYMNHVFGVASLEHEDNMLRLDRTLADLFEFIDDAIGLKNTLIVLSADHGAPEAPEYMAAHGMAVDRLVPSKFDVEPDIAALKKRFGIGKELVKMYDHPYIYLDHKLIREKGLDLGEVERAVAEEMMKFEGIALAISGTDIKSGSLPEAPVIEQIRRNFHPKRSGDIYVLQEPYWYLYTDESLPLCTMHGTPWRYDTYVPIIFAGKNIKTARVNRLVHPVDIVSTLALYVGTTLPSGAVGNPLAEVLGSGR